MQMRLSIGFLAVGLVLAVSLPATAQDTAQATPVPAPQAAPAASGGARIEVSPAEFDFGEVWEGAPAQGEFTIKNTGTEPLTIDAKSSCGCTVASKPKSPLGPGETTTFTISYSTRRRGPAHKSVFLNTNDPTQPKVTIPVKGTVKGLFTTTPSDRVNFAALEPDSVESQTITLTSEVDKPVHLKLQPDQTYEGFDVELKEVEAGKKYELTVTTKPPLKGGRANANILLATDLPEVQTLTLYAYANVPPRVSLRPARLYVFPNTQQRRTQQLQIEYKTKEPLNIKEMKSDIEGVTFEEVAAPAAADPKLAMKVINVTLPTFDEMKVDQGVLEIYTDDKSPEYQKLEVPIVKRNLQSPRVGGTPARPADRSRVRPGPGVGPTSQPGEKADADAVRKAIEEAIRKAQEAKKQPAGGEKAKPAGEETK